MEEMSMNKLKPFPLLKHLAWFSPHLTDRERNLAIAIALHRISTTGTCNPTLTNLCENTGHSRKVVVKTLILLEKRKVIKIEKGSGTRASNYIFLYDENHREDVAKQSEQELSSLPF
jgi:hypothetical protein